MIDFVTIIKCDKKCNSEETNDTKLQPEEDRATALGNTVKNLVKIGRAVPKI